MKRNNESTIITKSLASVIILFLLIFFILFTYNAPEVNLFRDYITGEYGINKNEFLNYLSTICNIKVDKYVEK